MRMHKNNREKPLIFLNGTFCVLGTGPIPPTLQLNNLNKSGEKSFGFYPGELALRSALYIFQFGSCTLQEW